MCCFVGVWSLCCCRCVGWYRVLFLSVPQTTAGAGFEAGGFLFRWFGFESSGFTVFVSGTAAGFLVRQIWFGTLSLEVFSMSPTSFEREFRVDHVCLIKFSCGLAELAELIKRIPYQVGRGWVRVFVTYS